MTLYGYRLPAMSSLILWGLLWEAIGQMEVSFFVPPLSEVIVTLFEVVQTSAFQKALWETAYAFLAGVFFSIVIGIPTGILMGKNRLIDELLLPWVNIFLSVPLTALVPVLMVLFGFGMTSIIITTTLFAIWIIILNARVGVMQINRSLVDMARSFGASPWDAFVKIYFWAALPEILGGVRIGIIRAVKGVIIGQLLISIVGFGALFELYSNNFLMSHFWAVLLVLFALAFSISELLAMLERRVAYYAAKR
ncbi:ABC transporter permease subunit [Silicimonas algicola]|uniref:NitT/TauT family transport system permease protein n=1 Tax=Silicimonas algicola TaxID=1826607 RepID=A0A316G3T4_9RHOB|nr:ABC transporter permease subunit [Silicimonas algicola]AZQ67006.1 ABC transporter permease subunit [Silicimonas algicola]PWK55478.1 NitT/TauT family transport system permease protein [Silicimonas algicola]